MAGTTSFTLPGLPLELLDGILSLLDIRDAARASTACRSLRTAWLSLSSLRFYQLHGEAALYSAATTALRRHVGPISRFSFFQYFRHGGDPRDCLHVSIWPALLAGVRELRLVFYSAHPISIDCFTELTLLELRGLKLNSPAAEFIGFRWLTMIRFHSVEMRTEDLQSIVRMSPQLQELEILAVKLVDLDHGSTCRIQARSLRALVVIWALPFHCSWLFNDCPLLHRADISFPCGSKEEEEDGGQSSQLFTKSLASLHHVRELNLGHGCLQVINSLFGFVRVQFFMQ